MKMASKGRRAGPAARIAGLPGVQHRRQASGAFNHSSSIGLLDAEGRIVARSGTLGAVDPALVDALRKALAGG